MRSVFRQSRAMLCAGVSLAALSLAYPLHAADLNPSLWTKAPVLDRGEWRGFIEGGVFWTGGDPVPFRGGFDAFFNGFNGGDCEGVRCFPKGSVPTARPGLGWDVAMGADYRFAGTPWHVNMEGRYGRVTKLDKSSDDPFYSSFSSFNNGCGPVDTPIDFSCSSAITASAGTRVELVESHWQADFGMGYDFLRGAQINFGFRVAEIRSDITATTGFGLTEVDPTQNLCASIGACTANANGSSVQIDRREFFGAGPRLGLVGSVPLIGALFFDYSGNAAVLFGNTKFSTGQVLAFSGSSTFVSNNNLSSKSASFSGIVADQLTWTAPNVVYNFDIQAGFSYWFTPNWALKLSYRLDAFIDPLRVAPDDGVTRRDIGPGRSMDRYYHGPKAAVIAKF